MTTSRLWTPLTILLITIITVSSIIIWSRLSASQGVEILVADGRFAAELPSRVYVGGAVASPGFYPLRAEDSLKTLIEAAGGTTTTTSAGPDLIKLYVNVTGDEATPQKINLNRAEVWLLQALPGIGEEKAKAIITYRRENGLFRSTGELTKVTGIGTKTLEQIKHLITVAD